MDRDTSPRGGDGNDVDDVGNNVAAATTVGTSTRLRRRRQGLATSLLATTKQILPVVAWAPHYRPAFLFDDFISALTVATVVIPQSMAYAILAGLKPQYGLYTAVIPVVLYALMGTSRHLQIGMLLLLHKLHKLRSNCG